MELLKILEQERAAVHDRRPSKQEAEEAVRTLIRWAGDDPTRRGLVGTPDRVVRSYREFFGGYEEDPAAMLSRTFEEADGYDEMITLTNIRLESYCEHHIVPIIGVAHIGYLPNKRVVGISEVGACDGGFAKRLQIKKN